MGWEQACGSPGWALHGTLLSPGGDNSKGAHSTPAGLEAGPLAWTPAPCSDPCPPDMNPGSLLALLPGPLLLHSAISLPLHSWVLPSQE